MPKPSGRYQRCTVEDLERKLMTHIRMVLAIVAELRRRKSEASTDEPE
jgi:hypothetical protein